MTTLPTLTDLSLQWGLDLSAADKAPEALTSALTEASSPELALSALQILWLDPEQPHYDNPAIQRLKEVLKEAWPTVATSPDGRTRTVLMPIQAVVLCGWTQYVEDVALVEATRMVMNRKQPLPSQSEAYKRWLQVTLGKMSWPEVPSDKPPAAPSAPVYGPTIDDMTFNPHPAHLEDNKTKLKTVLGQISNHTTQSFTTLQGWTKDALDRHRAQEGALSRILWWGQSRYCVGLERPFRKLLDEPARLVWWAASELAPLCHGVPLAPASSYLVEVLRSMGLGIEEKRSLADWMQETAQVLRADRKEFPKPEKALQKFVAVSPLGLPVLWLRWKCAGEKETWDEIAQDARQELGLDLEVEIERAEWAEWLLHELVLEQRWRRWGEA